MDQFQPNAVEMSILEELEERFQRLERFIDGLLDLNLESLSHRVSSLERQRDLEQKAQLLSEGGVTFAEVPMEHEMDEMDADAEEQVDSTEKLEVPDSEMPQLPEQMQIKVEFQKRTTASLSRRIIEDRDVEPQDYYEFAESTWDLALFAGHEKMGCIGSIQSVALAIATILMQVVSFGIAWNNFIDPEITESTITDALQWRRSVAHSFAQYDALSGKSLVQRVCQEDKSLHLSGIQMTLFEDITKYLQPDADGISAYFTGQTLCIVALLCWYMMVARDVSQALMLHRAMMALPTSGRTKIEPWVNPFTQVIGFRLKSATRKRKLLSYFLLGYRLLSDAFLVYVGSLFLAYTVNVTELLLNAVSLGIILDIDNYIFWGCAPTAGRDLLDRFEALHVPSYPRVMGADVKSILLCGAVPALAMAVYLQVLEPMTRTLAQVGQILCGGEQAFVWAIDQRRMTLLARTNSTIDMNFAKLDAIEEAGAFLSGPFTDFAVWVDRPTTLSNMQAMSLQEQIADANPECADLADQNDALMNYLRDALGNFSIQSCADAIGYCSSLTSMPNWGVDGGRGFLTRMLCSTTCGCNDPGGEFIFVQGCPYASKECLQTERYQSLLQQGSCEDLTLDELRNFTPWVSWVRQLRSYAASPGNQLPGQEEVGVLAEAMWDWGCDFKVPMLASNITWGSCFEWSSPFDFGFKTVAFYCPSSCGCENLSPEMQEDSCPQPGGLTCQWVLTGAPGSGVGAAPDDAPLPDDAPSSTRPDVASVATVEGCTEISASSELFTKPDAESALRTTMATLANVSESHVTNVTLTENAGCGARRLMASRRLQEPARVDFVMTFSESGGSDGYERAETALSALEAADAAVATEALRSEMRKFSALEAFVATVQVIRAPEGQVAEPQRTVNGDETDLPGRGGSPSTTSEAGTSPTRPEGSPSTTPEAGTSPTGPEGSPSTTPEAGTSPTGPEGSLSTTPEAGTSATGPEGSPTSTPSLPAGPVGP